MSASPVSGLGTENLKSFRLLSIRLKYSDTLIWSSSSQLPVSPPMSDESQAIIEALGYSFLYSSLLKWSLIKA